MKKFYTKLQKKMLNLHVNGSDIINKHDGCSALALYKSLFEEHGKTLAKDTGDKLKIPKMIHQIWIGPHPLPEKYRAWQSTWQSLAGSTYKSWTDKEVKDFPLVNK